MTLDDFIKKYSGIKDVGNTPENKGECVGLAMLYIAELGLSHIWGHARDIYANALSTEHEKIKNAPKVYPQKGDIITWDKTKGAGFGHIAIVVSSDPVADTFTVFEQNNPLGAAPKISTYKSWSGVIGWLRPKNLPVENECEKKIHELEETLTGVRKSRDEWKLKAEEQDEKHAKEISEKNADYERIQKTLSEANQANADKTVTISQLQQTIQMQLAQLEELENTKIDIIKDLKDAELLILSQTQDIEDLKAKLKRKLKDFSLWEFLKSRW